MTRSRSRSGDASRSVSRSPATQERRSTPRRSFSPRSRSRSKSSSRQRKTENLQSNGYRNDYDGRRSSRRSSGTDDHHSRGLGGSRSRSRSPQRSSKIVVEKLTKNVKEGHLREIFEVYGPLKDIDLPMNQQFMTNRGSAYILYERAVDAETATKHMHESQLDGAVINVSIVFPKRRFSRSPPPSKRVADFLDREAARGGHLNRARPYGSNSRYQSPPPTNRAPPSWDRHAAASHGWAESGHRRRFRSRSRSRSRSPRRSYSPSPRRQRSRSPRRNTSRSRSRSRSVTPPPRRGSHYDERDQVPRGRSGPRRESPTYSSYGSQSGRSRSQSPAKRQNYR